MKTSKSAKQTDEQKAREKYLKLQKARTLKYGLFIEEESDTESRKST